MDKTQEEKFKQAYDKEFPGPCALSLGREYMRKGYEACLEANGIGEDPSIPEGYFKIGEEVEYYRTPIGDQEGAWYPGIVTVTAKRWDTVVLSGPPKVRRIPAWKPKDGEVVFALYEGKAIVAKIIGIDGDCLVIDYDGRNALHRVSYRGENIYAKPFDASKIGKPWSEI